MIEYFKSVNNKYTYDNDKYLKNETPLMDEDGNSINDASFKLLIKKETSHFIHKNYGNIIVLAGAGASVVLNGNNICEKFGKTVSMLAELINKELKMDSNCFTLQELADFCKYNVPVEEVSYLKHSAFINTVSHLVKTPSKLSIVTTNYDTLIEDAADSIGFTVIDGFTFAHRPQFDSDMFEWNLVKDIENIKTRELEYKKNIINLLKLHGSLTWERSDKHIFRKEKNNVKKPIMIFPSSNKYMQSYQEPYCLLRQVLALQTIIFHK